MSKTNEEENQDMASPKDIPVKVIETPPNSRQDNFTSRKEMRDKDGVHTIMWANGSNMTVERIQKVDTQV